MPRDTSKGSREWIAGQVEGRHPGTVHLVKLFAWAHLPTPLWVISAQSGTLALAMVDQLPDGPELTTGLRKLLEAKDCFVRASIAD